MLAPPPPARRSRRPFITCFLGDVLPFLEARDLLVCERVSKMWREEARTISLWRALLLQNPTTSSKAYCGLSLNSMKCLLLRRGSSVVEECSTQRDSDSTSNSQRHGGLVSSLRVPPVNTFATKENLRRSDVSSFSSGIQSKHGFEALSSSPLCKLKVLQNGVQSLLSYVARLSENLNAETRSLSSLSRKIPTSTDLYLYHECKKRLKTHVIFEEIVARSLCSTYLDQKNLNVRTFVHIEIATLHDVGSAAHLQWCKFKKLFPVNERYYDYMDCLNDLGSERLQFLQLRTPIKEEAMDVIERFTPVYVTALNIIKGNGDDIRLMAWENLLQQLPNGQ